MILTDYRFLLDVHEINSQISLSFKQGDTGRVLYITLTENGDIFNIPQNCVAVFTALKPDGTIIFNDCEINGNEIVYTHTAQTAAVTGKVDCELRLYGAGNTLITSPHFTIFVHPTVYFDQIESKDEVNTLTNLITETSTKLANGDFVPKLGIGEVKTLPAGSMATVEMSGTADAPILNFAIPQGEQGQAESLIPDTELSLTSVKPVQNSVIAKAINERKEAFETHRDSKENPHGVSKAQVGLDKVDNTADSEKPVSKAQAEALGKLVEKVEGKELSTNDFTNAYKEKLDGIEAGANKTEAPKDGDISTNLIADKAVSFDKLGDDAKSLAFENIIVPDWAWDESDDSTLFPLRAAIALPENSGVDASYFVDVSFDDESLSMCELSPKAVSYEGGFYIYAASYPEILVKINAVDCTPTKPLEIASEVFGTISVTYAAGKNVTCTDGAKTLLAKTASGSWQFGVPNAGAWIVSDGENHEVVEITTQGKVVDVTLKAPLVPAEYQAVEYLGATGSQYINTGLYAKDKYLVTLTAQYTNVSWSGSKDESWLFGDWIAGYCYLIGFYQGKFCVAVGADNTTDRYETAADTNIHTFAVKSDHYEIDGVAVPGVVNWSKMPQTGKNILLGISPHTEDAYLSRKIMRCEMFTQDGEKIRDFIPCYRKSDSVAGMWDKVSKTFFTNAGTGTFTVGLDI